MPFDVARDSSRDPRKNIAVIGSGIAGLSAAWGLSKTHHVTLYERDTRTGGHSNTVYVSIGEKAIPVDMGFIVYNEANYPNLVALFEHLGVETAASDMSFGVSIDEGRCEYSGQTLSSVFATRKNALSPSFWWMLVEVTRFHRLSRRALMNGITNTTTLGAFLQQHKFSARFRSDFIIPMAGAIWSAPSEQILDYPAQSFLKFYDNHGLLQVLDMPLWRTVKNGSRHYINAILNDFSGTVKTGAAVQSVRRSHGQVYVSCDGEGEIAFDEVVLATHGDSAAQILHDADEEEASILKAFTYLPNRAVLHTDVRHMPNKREAWSAWNVLRREGEAEVTYWMNKLQPLDTDEDIFVTLNPIGEVENARHEFPCDHPLFTIAACQAQKDIWTIQGRGGVWYCGAHLGSGFHEDGIQAGLAVAEAIGGFRRPWQVAHESGRISLPSGITRTIEDAAHE